MLDNTGFDYRLFSLLNFPGAAMLDFITSSMVAQWAFCTNWSHGTKSAILDGKKSVASSTGTSKT